MNRRMDGRKVTSWRGCSRNGESTPPTRYHPRRMVFLFTPGQALGCNVNAHRNGWNGTVCSDATNWSCSADQAFRDSYCMRGDSRCYHVHLFDAQKPRFQVDDNGIGWVLHVDPRALDDQVLLIWGGEFGEPRGLKENRGRGPIYGAYRVQQCRKVELPYRVLWEVVPYPDGWTRFHNLRVARPTNRALSGKYLREVDRSSLLSAFAEGKQAADERNDLAWFVPEDAARFRDFSDHLEEWLTQAAKAAEARGHGQRNDKVGIERASSGPRPASPLSSLRSIMAQRNDGEVPARPAPVETPRAAGTPRLPPPMPPAAPQKAPTEIQWTLEPAAKHYIAETYGDDILMSLRLAALTKPLMILRGNTGVGKSQIATRMIDDPKGERTLIVPVAATWRGREDLLGYVNPISTEFEPTKFTEFLFAAASAWEAGDHRVRLVVFEEFNLSQPEHWFSDLLAISQFENALHRRISLGGKNVRGIAAKESTVTLSPAIRFVATINNDHTTRPLSPRVLDRAAIVELDLEPRRAVRLAGAGVDEEQLLPITELDELLRQRGASFSLRTARSLSACLHHLEMLGIGVWQAIDLVLVQEVLSKVRLLARDPNDAELMKDLQRWSGKHGRNLARCSRTIESWNEALDSGADVVQA